MFPKQWEVQASSKTQPKPTGLKGCYTRNDIEIQAENYWRGLETIALYSCLYFEAVKESETSNYSNLTLQCDLIVMFLFLSVTIAESNYPFRLDLFKLSLERYGKNSPPSTDLDPIHLI